MTLIINDSKIIDRKLIKDYDSEQRLNEERRKGAEAIISSFL